MQCEELLQIKPLAINKALGYEFQTLYGKEVLYETPGPQVHILYCSDHRQCSHHSTRGMLDNNITRVGMQLYYFIQKYTTRPLCTFGRAVADTACINSGLSLVEQSSQSVCYTTALPEVL